MTERPNKLVDGELVPLTDDELAEYLDRLNNPPDPVVQVPQMVTAALNVSNGEIDTIDAPAIAGAMALDTGVYWLFFAASIPNAAYIATIGCMAPNPLVARVTARKAEYVEITATDLTGTPAEPEKLFLTINRLG